MLASLLLSRSGTALTAAAALSAWRRSCSDSAHRQLRLPTGLFGCLTVAAPGRAVEVASLDPVEHPGDIGQVLVAETAGVRAERTGERDWLVETAGAGEKRPLRVMVPVPMDLRVSSSTGCSLSVVENRSIHLAAASTGVAAEFRLDRVKSGDVEVRADAGSADVSLSRTLLRSLKLIARHGATLRASMYQGSEVSLESPGGAAALEAGAVYCRQCSVRGVQASLRCGSAHGDFQLEASDSGSVRLDSLEGSLQVRMLYGDVSLHLTKPRQVSIDLGEGGVRIGLQQREVEDSPAQGADSPTLLLDVTATGVDLDAELAHLADQVFPLGPHAVRLVAEVPGCSVADGGGCTVRVQSGRVRLGLRSGSELFAKLASTGK